MQKAQRMPWLHFEKTAMQYLASLKNKEWKTLQTNCKTSLLERRGAVHSPLILWELCFWLAALRRADVAIARVLLHILSSVARLHDIIINLCGSVVAPMASGSNTAEQRILNHLRGKPIFCVLGVNNKWGRLNNASSYCLKYFLSDKATK